MPDLAPILQQFNLSGEPCLLPGGSTQTFQVQNVVLKRIKATSLENNHSPELAAWIAGWTARIPQDGFRLPRPLTTIDGSWITPDGWTAIEFLEGHHAGPEEIPACVQAIRALHHALVGIPKHPLMDENRTAWGHAHRWCWGKKPRELQPELRPLINRLYSLRKPVETSPWQLMHGDLNPSNFLIAPGQLPAILDFSPFWGPPEFALAIFANFSGPRRRDMSTLRHFEHIPGFDQLLIRAAIRMLLVVSVLNGLDGWEDSEEKWAAEHIIEYVTP